MLKFSNYSVRANKKTILEKINLMLHDGKVYALMGPNGSGKSTLAMSAAGSPLFSVSRSSKLYLDKTNIAHARPDIRCKSGIFATFQSPPELSGVNVFQVLRTAMGKTMDPLTLKKKIESTANELHIPKELLSRSLHEGFSGGERKKMEVLQMAILNPSVIFFDEIDTGVDVDALKTITKFLKKYHTPDKTYVLITHYTRILKHLRPKKILIMKDGKIVKQGDYSLAQKVEKGGYDQF